MEKLVVTSELILEEVAVEQASVDDSNLHRRVDSRDDLKCCKTSLPCAGSCNSSYSKDEHSLDSSKASGVTEDLNLLQNANTSLTEEHKNQDGCDSLGSSFISEDNHMVIAISGHLGGDDHRAMTCSAASVSRSCPEVLEKSMNGQFTAASGDHISGEQGNKSSISMPICPNDPVLPCKDSDGSDRSETSSCRNDLEGSTPAKDVAFECSKEQVDSLVAKMLKPNVSSHDSTMESLGLLNPEAEFSDANLSAHNSLKIFDGLESLKSDKTLLETQALCIKSQNLTQIVGLDELVDVRVCDICGDVGREALLALCSNCNDGAEHVYCMSMKMDQVPHSGWMCEECVMMQESKRQSPAVLDTSDRAVSLSRIGELKQSWPRKSSGVKLVDETCTSRLSRASSFPGKRLGPCIEMRAAPKKRAFEQNVHPLNSLHSVSKTRLTHMSSLNSMKKGKATAQKVSSLGDRLFKRAFERADISADKSPRPEKQFGKGYPYRSKTEKFSELDMKVKKLKVDVPPRKSIDESIDSKQEKAGQKKKLFKSLSFAGVSSVPQDVSNAQSSHASKVKGLKCGVGSDMAENFGVPEKKLNQLGVSSTGSASMNVCSSRTNVVSKIATQICRIPEVKVPSSFAPERKKHAELSGQSLKEKMSTGHASYAIRSSGKDAISYPDQKSSQLTPEAELNSTTEKDCCHLVSSKNSVEVELHSVISVPTLALAKMVPPEISVVPAAEWIWKGALKLKESGELTNHCSGVQAHLSTRASSEVHEVVSRFGPVVFFKVVPRSQTWPIQSQKNFPTEQDIAFFLFAEDLQSYERSYKKLLEDLMRKDLVLEANFDKVQLLVFPSSLLPETFQRWNSLSFLWGFHRVRKGDDNSSHLPRLDVTTLNHDISSPNTYDSLNKGIPPMETGSPCTSHTSHNPVQVPELVNSAELQVSAFTKSVVQNCELAASLMKCAGEENYVQPDTFKSSYDLKQETVSGAASHSNGMLRGTEYDDRDVNCIKKTDHMDCSQSKGANVASLAVDCGGSGIHPDESCRGPSFPWIHNSASEVCPRLEITSWSSVPSDSGPSGSSEGHGEQLENPKKSGAVNLDLSLGLSSEPDVDLDLGLSFPSIYEQCTKSRSNGDENISLVLSLGLPCSNA